MAAIDLAVRVFLGVFFLMIGLQFTARALGLYNRMGFSHIHYGRRGSAPWWHRHTFNLFRAAILAVCLVRIVADIDPWLGRISWLYHGPVLLLGVACLLGSFTAINYLQAYMHEDWRSGPARSGDSPRLLMEGPFGRSRNPQFLAVMLGQLGFFLALPSVFSLVCLLVGVVVLARQARSEETALAERFGATYLAYRDRVPRWFAVRRPAFGRP